MGKLDYLKIDYKQINTTLSRLAFPVALLQGASRRAESGRPYDFTLRIFVDNPTEEMVKTAVSCVGAILSGTAWEYEGLKWK